MRPIVYRLAAIALLTSASPAGAQQVLAPATAVAAESAPQNPTSGAPFQVVRAGDNSMSCQALIIEITDLSVQIQQIQTAVTEQSAAISRSSMAATRRPGGMGGAAVSLGGLAASFIPGGAYVMGAVSAASALASEAHAANQQQQITTSTEAVTTAMANMAPIAERSSHLAEISRTKGC